MPPALPGPLAISAAPFYDVVIDRTYPGDPKAHAFQEAGGPGGRDGFYHRMLVGLLARNPNGNGKKGVEQLDPTKPVVIDLDVSGYPQSVRLDNWRTKDNTAAKNLPQASFGDGCGSIWQGRPRPPAGAGGPCARVLRGPAPVEPPGRALRNEGAYRFPFGSGSSFTETPEHIPLAVAQTQWWPVSGTPQYLTVATVRR